MASKNSTPRSDNYDLLTDIQKSILKRYYDEGMVGTGRQYREIINRAAEETKLARTKVEVSLVEMYFTVRLGNKMYQQDEILRRNTPKFNVRNI